MRIASITMVGQFPDGIDLHIRNLKWALTENDHIFIVTLSEFIDKFALKNDKSVTYIPFKCEEKHGFINFWGKFPEIFKNVKPEWFFFTELDVLFIKKPEIPKNKKTILSCLPLESDYHNIMLNNRLFHYRVWEGGQFFHNDLIKRAINYGINFSFVKNTFLHKNRTFFENKYSGKIELSSVFKDPDTMDEFGLYCALVENTEIKENICAVHIRGPETLHRKFPEVYHYANISKVNEVQRELRYFDVKLAIAYYYIVGIWREIEHLEWHKCSDNVKMKIKKLMNSEWMSCQEQSRVSYLDHLMCVNEGHIS